MIDSSKQIVNLIARMADKHFLFREIFRCEAGVVGPNQLDNL